ncbi:hypothetical protein NFI96_010154 [Prochilodus magdalenae]|nr:hypothetical protein NFI96_010154 [Prochilodus magdalenae]
MTRAPQGTVLSPVLFTLYTSDFKYNSELCHMQKFSDDTAIVGCVRNGQEREYRSLVEDFVEWCTTNHLKLNITKTKEMCIDFRRSRSSQQPISIKGFDMEVIRSYKYLGVHLDEKLDWSVNTDTVYKKAQSRLYFLRRLGSFRICQKLLVMFYQSVVASVLFYAVVCWGGSISRRDAGRLDRLVRKAGFVLGLELESLTPLAERRALNKLLNIMENVHHPLHSTIIRQKIIQWQTAVPVLLHRQTQKVLYVLYEWDGSSGDVLCSLYPPLKGLALSRGGTTIPHSDAACQDAFHGGSIEVAEELLWQVDCPQPS